MDIIIIISTALALGLGFNISTWISASHIGLKLNEFTIGFGPILFKHFFGRSRLSIRLLPVAASIDFFHPTKEYGLKKLEVHQLKSVEKILLMLPGPIFHLAVGLIILSVCDSRTFNIIAFLSIFTGLVGFLPIPSQNGFVLFTMIFPSLRKRPIDKILPPNLQTILLLLCFILLYGFLVYFMIYTDEVLKIFHFQ